MRDMCGSHGSKLHKSRKFTRHLHFYPLKKLLSTIVLPVYAITVLSVLSLLSNNNSFFSSEETFPIITKTFQE